jgi:hypothetical protein
MTSRPQHQLVAEYDRGEAAVSCGECGYAFTAPGDHVSIDLGARAWIDRGDRDAVHLYLKTQTELEVMMHESWLDRS